MNNATNLQYEVYHILQISPISWDQNKNNKLTTTD